VQKLITAQQNYEQWHHGLQSYSVQEDAIFKQTTATFLQSKLCILKISFLLPNPLPAKRAKWEHKVCNFVVWKKFLDKNSIY